MAPGGSSVLTPFGEVDCAKPKLGVMASAIRHSSTARASIRSSILLFSENGTPARIAGVALIAGGVISLRSAY
jgi:multidrug transporter EmrE-like cation transporter